jgi:hypothetical protein
VQPVAHRDLQPDGGGDRALGDVPAELDAQHGVAGRPVREAPHRRDPAHTEALAAKNGLDGGGVVARMSARIQSPYGGTVASRSTTAIAPPGRRTRCASARPGSQPRPKK